MRKRGKEEKSSGFHGSGRSGSLECGQIARWPFGDEAGGGATAGQIANAQSPPFPNANQTGRVVIKCAGFVIKLNLPV